MSALLQLVTGRDNRTHDLGRWSWLIDTLAVLGLAARQEWAKSGSVSIRDLAIALAAVAAAHGVALGLKASTEPSAAPTQE
jgi:hypothetical protein